MHHLQLCASVTDYITYSSVLLLLNLFYFVICFTCVVIKFNEGHQLVAQGLLAAHQYRRIVVHEQFEQR